LRKVSKGISCSLSSDQEAQDPETVAARNQILNLIIQIINEDLTDRQRFALIKVHIQGIPMVEVARQLNSTSNNVYKLVHDARKKLKKGLQQRHYSEADILAIFGEK
ncbi:MAG: sigma factor-like helix-turn-helix DNA-binding protein, partial [Chloroflexota bacterium]|nr:sigma factor-like helix-turn-helix DNA-binding protein [Chloroflexota bacterium]